MTSMAGRPASSRSANRSRVSCAHGMARSGDSVASRSSDVRSMRASAWAAATATRSTSSGSPAGSASAVMHTRPSRSTTPGGQVAVARHAPAERALERRVDPLPDLVARPRDGPGGGADRRHHVVGVGVAERLGDGVLLLEQQPVAGPAGAAVQLDPGREQHVVVVRQRLRRRPRASPPAACSAQRMACTSRSPPRPSLRSGSSRKATSPACSWRIVTRLLELAQPPLGPLAPQRQRLGRRARRSAPGRRPGGGPSTSDVAVSRSSAASDSASLMVRTEWPSFRPSSQIGYQIRSAMAPMPLRPVVQQHHVEIALRRQLAPAVAADGDQGHARRPPTTPRGRAPAATRPSAGSTPARARPR